MARSELAGRVREAIEIDLDQFHEQVRLDGNRITEEIGAGVFDNPQAIIGFEYELYAADIETNALRRVPRRLLEYIGFEKELGLHNAEMSTSPQPLNEDGLRAQEAEIRSRLAAALQTTEAEGMRLVSDGMWTIPPIGESAADYLGASVEDGGVQLATNMSESVRYHAMANAKGEIRPAMCIEVPHVTFTATTVMPESLITSIQPHYQVPHAMDLPDHFNYALRIAGPLVALGANSPVFPPDLYDDDDPRDIIASAWHSNRIFVFESVLNPIDATRTNRKVRFPRDLDSVEQAVERVVAEPTLVTVPIDKTGRYDDQFGHFRLKHGTHWRWIRPVFDGATRSDANARIEFRPIGAQPTVDDSVGFLVLFAGLMESLPRRAHPVIDMSWKRARENFYTGARDGIDGIFEWIDNDGAVTNDTSVIFEEIFAHARDGLNLRGFSTATIDAWVSPLERRVEIGRTPAQWKLDRIATELADGATLESAITSMQRGYIAKQDETLLTGTFADWS